MQTAWEARDDSSHRTNITEVFHRYVRPATGYPQKFRVETGPRPTGHAEQEYALPPESRSFSVQQNKTYHPQSAEPNGPTASGRPANQSNHSSVTVVAPRIWRQYDPKPLTNLEIGPPRRRTMGWSPDPRLRTVVLYVRAKSQSWKRWLERVRSAVTRSMA